MSSASTLFDRIVSAVAEGHREAADAVVADVKSNISVPVGYAIGPRGGLRKIRSKPGEPPRKDTGRLQASITTDTLETTDVVNTAVYTETPYARRLELDMHRPILEGQVQTVDILFVQKIRDKLSQL